MTIAAEGPILRQEEEDEGGDNDGSEAIFLLPPGGRDESCCVSEQHYVESGNEKKVLYLLCFGLNCDGGNEPLFSFEREPWSLVSKTSFPRPKNTDFVKEIGRRASLFNITPVPRPSNWTRGQILDWLERNPVRDNADIEFLTNEVLRLQDVLARRAQEEQDLSPTGVGDSGRGGGRNWRGLVPYLRLIMCLLQDNVKRLFLTRANARSRQELDSRNSVNRPPTVFEAIAELWNSPHFNPIAPASECHFDFVNAIDCSYEQVAGLSPATPQKIEDIIVSIRSDLLRIITRWEQSGQGEGGRDLQDEEEEERGDDEDSVATSDDDMSPLRQRRERSIGGLTGRPPRALQSRASFLNGRPSYLLYYWEVADAHQLLQSSLQRLNNDTGACDASSAPSTATGSSRAQRRRQQQQDQDSSSSFIPLVQSIKELAECQRQLVLDRAEDRQHERQLEQQRQELQGAQQSRDWHLRRRAELTDMARKYRKLDAELDVNDENSRRLSEFYVQEGRLLQEEIQQLDRSSGGESTSNNSGEFTSNNSA